MSLILLAPEITSKETVIATIAKIALRMQAKLYLSENESHEVYIAKHYDKTESYMYMGLSNEAIIKQRSEIADISINNQPYFMISGSDQANYDHLIFDFLNEYFIIHPDHYASVYDDFLISKDSLQNLNENGGYVPGWCY